MYIVESVQKIRDELSGGVAWGAVPAIRELGSVSKCTLTTDIKFHQHAFISLESMGSVSNSVLHEKKQSLILNS